MDTQNSDRSTHREDGNQRGNATNALRLHRDTKEGLDTLLFCALRLPELEGSSLPARSVLRLLTGEHLEEGEGVTTRGMGPLEWVGAPGVFFYLRQEDAEQLWRSLVTQGWKRLNEPAWGSSVEV